MELNKQPLLSICIPTYNRAEILDRTLTTIVNDIDFDNSVEIVISDNASTDNTQQICQRFSEIYSNISYYRNENNINDANFFHVLNKGTGLYVKLSNDTITFKPGALKVIKDRIRESSLNENIFFFKIMNSSQIKKLDFIQLISSLIIQIIILLGSQTLVAGNTFYPK